MNLYEILEVNENASEETINKIYKIQAKRYHPDLQKTEAEKIEAEEKMKKINEAYNVLSNPQKRKEYDENLKNQRQREKEEDRQKIINETMQEYNNKSQNVYYNQVQMNKNTPNINQEQTQKNINVNQQKVYTKKDYIRDYNKRLRKLKFENWKKNAITNLKTIAIMAVIAIFIWFFPPTHKFLVNMYEENIVLQTIVEIFKRIVNSFKL